MKRILLIFCTLALFFGAFTYVSFAAAEEIKANPTVVMPYAEPNIDGIVSKDEGWSEAAAFNDETAGYFWAFNPLTTSGSIYFAYNDDGIFFAAELTELDYIEHEDQNGDMRVYEGNGFVPCTGEDKLDVKPGGIHDYGWNGDVLTLMIDPCGVLAGAGLDAYNDYSAWYDIGFFKNGKVKIYRGKVNAKEITSKCKAKAIDIKDGWSVEVFIPWNIIIEDTKLASDGKAVLKNGEVTVSGAVSRAAVMYMDRFVDPDSGLVDTWGRFITVSESTTTGTPGWQSSGDNIGAYGLTLQNGEKPAVETEVTEPETKEEQGNGDVNAEKDISHETPAETKSPTVGTSADGKKTTGTAAPTFDAGFAASLTMLTLSLAGLVYIRKRR